MSATDRVWVWLIRSDLPQPVLDGLTATLDQEERRRAELLHPARRAEFVAAHGAARAIAGDLLGVAPAALRWRTGRHGKPELPGLRVSLSRSDGLALFACAAGRAIGVDLQRHSIGVDPARAAARFYPPVEARYVSAGSGAGERARRFTGLLARKEACVKAAGGRLFPGLRLPVHGADRVLVGTQEPYLVRDLPAPDGFSAAVAVAGADDFQVCEQLWAAEERT